MNCPRCKSSRTRKEFHDEHYCLGCFHSFMEPVEPLPLQFRNRYEDPLDRQAYKRQRMKELREERSGRPIV